MKRYFILLMHVILCIGVSSAQERPVVLSSEASPDRSITINADSRSYCNMTVSIVFNSLVGYNSSRSSNELITVGQGKIQVAKLTPAKDAQAYSLSYTYTYFYGDHLNKKPDTSVIYLLPAAVNQKVGIGKANSVAEAIKKQISGSYYATAFYYALGDTVCAARGGIVYEANDAVKEGEARNTTFSADRNKLSIEQKDGTLAHYSILSPVKLLVEPGDKVIPGQPLAVLNKPADKYTVLLSVSYLDAKKLQNYQRTKEEPSYYVTLPLNFYAGDANTVNNTMTGSFLVAHPKDIITRELSKKEKKKMGAE